MRKLFETFTVGVLILLANAGVVIPYFFTLMLYSQNRTDPVYALPFLMLYTFRAIGMLLTAQIRKSAPMMLNCSSILGAVGAIFLIFAQNPVFGSLGGIMLGLSSSWIWPYFLTIRSRGQLDNEFSTNRNHMLSSAVALIVLLLIAFFADRQEVMSYAFFFLAILFVFAVFGGIYMKLEIDFYQNIKYEAGFVNPSRIILNLVYLLVLIVLIFSIRYSRLSTTSHYLDLVMCLLAAIVLGLTIYFQLDIHKKIFPLSLGALNRGVVMNYLLLYSTFDATIRFRFNATAWIFAVYILGFELGPMILKKFNQYRYSLLLLGLVLTLVNFAPVYFLGLFMAAIFVGADNVLLNDSLYKNPNLDGERAFLIKYQLSSIGNISQQLFLMSFIYLLSFAMNLNVLSFFNATVPGASYQLLTIVHLVVDLVVLAISSVTYYFVRKYPQTDD